MNKVTTLPKRTPRAPELEPLSREDFEDSCIADDITGVVGDAAWEAAQDAADSMWQVL